MLPCFQQKRGELSLCRISDLTRKGIFRLPTALQKLKMEQME